ncbi:MAG: undecaprenyl/decaprenyl-phosphate alpha-N-acetylglucosaminyl 1-phosphate transferase [Endomicrobiales bacterium]|nr:undecaprenyl/decaprenyl-phosphate alpha-N-acetylglucosaminyl 1-phosphate transferase [Endomicrobiales bacterium]
MIYLLGFILAFVGTVVFTPASIIVAKKFNVLDYPRARKVHRKPLPRWGGIGIYLGFFIAILVLFKFVNPFRELMTLEYKSVSLFKQLLGIVFGSSLIFILGIIDDKKPVKSFTKLLVQIIAVYIAIDYGVRIQGLAIPFVEKYYNFPLILGQIVTVFWLTGFMNTINLADGLDGLAAGIGAIAAGTFFIVALLQATTSDLFLSKQLALSSVLAITLMGACLGFLVWNFYPAKVFMGDCGALFIGYILATTSVIGTLKSTAVIALFIPIVVVALPILDVALSIFRRLRKGMGVMEPDKDHIHHRLLSFGWTQREVVLLMYVFTLILSIGSILLTVLRGRV